MTLKTKVMFLAVLCVAAQVIAEDGCWWHGHLGRGFTGWKPVPLEQIERTYSEMPPVRYRPPADRLHRLPKTRQRLTEGGTLRVVMLGDSIVNDTSRSCWILCLERDYPNCRIEKITFVRGSTGCSWFKRDPIHANERGEQILGRILAKYISPLAVAENNPEALDIGSRLELFVDDFLIEWMKGVNLTLHRPVCREVVIVHDKPWEGNTCGYHTVFKDGDIYRMYYRGWNHDNKTQKQLHKAMVCYAQSNDGIHWKRPVLGLVEFNGRKENNIILKGIGSHNFTPFKDTNPNCAANKRYKAVARGEDEGSQQLFAFQSADGIHWQLMQSGPVITEGAFDSQNLTFWDAVRNEYRCYFRDFRAGVRDIKTSTSRDFIHWTKPLWLQYPGAPKEHLYTNQIQPYYRAPHIFIGLPTRYIPERGSLTEGLLMTSRDGKTFHRWPEAIVRPGRNRDKWNNRSNYIWLGMVETESSLPGAGRELSLYSNERYYDGPGVKTRRYTYRIDGFVSVRAPLSGGEFVTKPLVFSGSELVLNFSTSAAGSVRVEIQDAQGHPIKGFGKPESAEIYGDEIKYRVKWKGGSDLSKLAGKAVRLRFVLRDADLYSIQFK